MTIPLPTGFVKNPDILSEAQAIPTGADCYFRPGATPGAEFIRFGYVTISNRTKVNDKFEPEGNLNGISQKIASYSKTIGETMQFYTKSNNNADVLRIYYGGNTFTGTSTSGFDGVIGLVENGTPSTGDFLLINDTAVTGQNVRIAYYPSVQINGNGVQTEDIAEYPQFDLTTLAWGTWTPPEKIAPYVQSTSNNVKVTFLVPAAKVAEVLTEILGSGGVTSDWQATHNYALNATAHPANGHTYHVTTAGESGATEPTWPTASGGTVVDGTVHWTEGAGS